MKRGFTRKHENSPTASPWNHHSLGSAKNMMMDENHHQPKEPIHTVFELSTPSRHPERSKGSAFRLTSHELEPKEPIHTVFELSTHSRHPERSEGSAFRLTSHELAAIFKRDYWRAL